MGNGTSPQLEPDNDRMLENMPVVLNNGDSDKVNSEEIMCEHTFVPPYAAGSIYIYTFYILCVCTSVPEQALPT